MKKASVSQVKNGLSAYIDRVRKGGAVLITDRGTPVAQIVPAVGGDLGTSSRLARLERHGLVARGGGRKLPWVKEQPPATTRPIDLDIVLRHTREDRF